MKRAVLLPIVMLGLMSSNLATANPLNAGFSSVVSNDRNEKSAVDAIEIILQDHTHIRKTFSTLEKKLSSNITESKSIFKELKEFLIKHETMEQKIWYPALEKHADLKEIIAALKKEENDANKAIKKLEGIKDDKEWMNKVKTLKNDVEHHAKEEETKLFPKVSNTLDKATLNTLGAKLKAYHDKNNM